MFLVRGADSVRRRAAYRRSSPATAGSPSPCRRRSVRSSRRSWRTAAATPSPASAAGTRKARRGTAPACASTSNRSSTTSTRPPTGWSPEGITTALAARHPRRLERRAAVGAAITQRPDLCRAAVCAVPLLDMVRYHRFLIARLWIPEYGDPDVAEEFAWLYAYSPYHHVVDGTCYPAVLVETGEEDSRVDPMHARKIAARLQAATSCGRRAPDPRADRSQSRPRAGQAGDPPSRRSRRRPRLRLVAARRSDDG